MFVYPNKPYYVISGFCPPAEKGLGRYGFNIGLQAGFAKRCLQEEVTEQQYENISKTARSIIGSVFSDKEFRRPYNFRHRDDKVTLLLAWCSVPGNSCEVGLDRTDDHDRIMKMKDDRMLVYGQHNIDSLQQASVLLSIWLNWFDLAFAIVEKDENN